MTWQAMLELGGDFMVVSTAVLAGALLIVACTRTSLRRDAILKFAIVASVLMPMARSLTRGHASIVTARPFVVSAQSVSAPDALAGAAGSGNSVAELASLLWLAGVGAALLLVAIRSTRMRRRAASRVPLLDSGWCEALRALNGRAALSVVPDTFASPFCIGREICVPAWMVTSLGASQRVAVLAHELDHIRRRDAQWTFAADLMCALFFVQPLLLVARKRLRTLIEERADGAAVRELGTGLPLAEVLLQVTQRLTGESEPQVALLRRSSPLVRRVEVLLRAPGPARVPFSAVAMQVILSLVAVAALPALEVVDPVLATPPMARPTNPDAVLAFDGGAALR